jgi:hypothetical protein
MTSMRERRNAGAALIVVGGFLALVLGVYASGYFLLSDGLLPMLWNPLALRTYPSPWLAAIYRPAAKIEGAIRGHPIDTRARGEY